MSVASVGPTVAFGNLTVQAVFDGALTFRGEEFFPEADWGLPEHRRWLDDAGNLVLPVCAFLVRSAGRTVLVDVGMGDVAAAEYTTGVLPASLAGTGVAPADVDAVVLSHLHFDHAGGATVSDGEARRAAFPNATYYCDPADWAHFVDGHHGMPAVASALRAIESRIEPLHDGAVVVPGLTTISAPGHTPGHCAFVLSGGGQQAYLLGDVIHCPLQVEEPELTAIGEVDRALARRTREALLREADAAGAQVSGPHFPGLRFGRLLTGGATRFWAVG